MPYVEGQPTTPGWYLAEYSHEGTGGQNTWVIVEAVYAPKESGCEILFCTSRSIDHGPYNQNFGYLRGYIPVQEVTAEDLLRRLSLSAITSAFHLESFSEEKDQDYLYSAAQYHAANNRRICEMGPNLTGLAEHTPPTTVTRFLQGKRIVRGVIQIRTRPYRPKNYWKSCREDPFGAHMALLYVEEKLISFRPLNDEGRYHDRQLMKDCATLNDLVRFCAAPKKPRKKAVEDFFRIESWVLLKEEWAQNPTKQQLLEEMDLA